MDPRGEGLKAAGGVQFEALVLGQDSNPDRGGAGGGERPLAGTARLQRGAGLVAHPYRAAKGPMMTSGQT